MLKKSIALIMVIAMVLGLAATGAAANSEQKPVTKDGEFYADVARTTENVGAGTKIAGNKTSYEVKIDGEKVASLLFDKNEDYVIIDVLDYVSFTVEWSCSKYYASVVLNGPGVFAIPQLLQDNGKLQSFNQIWIGEAKFIPANTDAYDALVAEAKAILKSVFGREDFTLGSWRDFEEAIAECDLTLTAADKQPEIDAMAAMIQAALDLLEGRRVISLTPADNIRNIINNAKNGDVFELAAGTYTISDTIFIDDISFIKIKGAGQGETIIRSNNNGRMESFIEIEAASNIEISDLTIDGTGLTFREEFSGGILASLSAGINIHDVTIKNINISYGDQIVLRNGVPNQDRSDEGDAVYGIHFLGAGYALDWDYWEDYYGGEDECWDAIGGPEGAGTREASYFFGVTDSVIENCTFLDIGMTSAWGAPIRLSWGCSRVNILNNTIDGAGRGGILLDNGCYDIVTRGNHIDRIGESEWCMLFEEEGLGIEYWGEADRGVIENNFTELWLSLSGAKLSAVRNNIVGRENNTKVRWGGLEGVAAPYSILTNNQVLGGQETGASISNDDGAQSFMYWAHNLIKNSRSLGVTIDASTQASAIRYHYWFDNTISNIFNGIDNSGRLSEDFGRTGGTAFRVRNNYVRNFVLDSNTFIGNYRHALDLAAGAADSGTNLRRNENWRLVNNVFSDNVGNAFQGTAAGVLANVSQFYAAGNTATGNANNNFPPSVGGIANGTISIPSVSIVSNTTVKVGEFAVFDFDAVNVNGTVRNVLWDFDDDIPAFCGPTVSGPLSALTGAAYFPVGPVTHVFDTPGTYRVAAIIWDTQDQGARGEITVTVVADDSGEVPAGKPVVETDSLVCGWWITWLEDEMMAVTLKWGAIEGAIGYIVEYGEVGEDDYLVRVNVPYPNFTEWRVATLDADGDYWFRVIPYNANGLGTASDIVYS